MSDSTTLTKTVQASARNQLKPRDRVVTDWDEILRESAIPADGCAGPQPKSKRKARKHERILQEDSDTSVEFDPDDPIGFAKEEKDVDAPWVPYTDPKAERKLLAATLKTGKFDPAAGDLDMAHFDDYGLGELWQFMLSTGEPITVKRILNCRRLHKDTFSGWNKDDLLELQQEADPDDSVAELAEEIRRGFACRQAAAVARNIGIWSKSGHEEFIAKECRSLLEDVEGVRLDGDRGMSSAELEKADFSVDYLIDDVLAAGQPMVIGGRSKSLKTGVGIELALSLGTGTKFLDRFPTQQARVAMWSGESGGAVIKETALRIAEHKEVKFREATCRWYFHVPLLSDAQHLARLRATILKHHLQVVIVDPLYLALHTSKTAGQAGNVFMAGSLLGEVTKIGQETNCTIVLLHHFAKTRPSNPADPATLEELSQAGMAEWARQWILLERREPYAFDGHHAMWMRTGGSAGHAGLWALDINEGMLPNRIWETKIVTAHEFKQAAAEAKEQQQAAEKHKKQSSLASQVELFLAAQPNGATATDIRKHLKVSSQVLTPILVMMFNDHKIVHLMVKKQNNKEYQGYTLAMNNDGKSGEGN